MNRMNAVCGEAASLFEMADYANVIFDFFEVFGFGISALTVQD
jgi:hypothetical protein